MEAGFGVGGESQKRNHQQQLGGVDGLPGSGAREEQRGLGRLVSVQDRDHEVPAVARPHTHSWQSATKSDLARGQGRNGIPSATADKRDILASRLGLGIEPQPNDH